MKKIIFLAAIMVLVGCSVESTDEFETLDARANIQNGEAEEFIVPELICAGEEATFTFNFAEKPGKTVLKVQLYGDNPETTEEIEEWYNIFDEEFDGGGPENFYYTFEEAGDYSIRYQIGGGGFTEVQVTVENCGCEESFSYAGENGSYTFTYIPEEDMANAELVFTFAQSVEVSGLEDWQNSGNEAISSTERITMNLIACNVYEWTVTLQKDCSGQSGNSNLWTDFKVNGESKKGTLQNIVQSCD